MSKRLIVYIAVLLTIINLTILGVIFYYQWVKSDTRRAINNFERVKQEVELTAEQAEQINEFRQSLHAELDSLETRLMAERKRLAQQIQATEPDTTEMRRIINRIGTTQQEAQHIIIRHLMHIRDVLNPEQRDRFFDIVLEQFVSHRRFPGSSPMPQNVDRP